MKGRRVCWSPWNCQISTLETNQPPVAHNLRQAVKPDLCLGERYSIIAIKDGKDDASLSGGNIVRPLMGPVLETGEFHVTWLQVWEQVGPDDPRPARIIRRTKRVFGRRR